MSVLVLQHRLCVLTHFLLGDPALTIGNAFKARYLQTLTLLDDLDERGGFGQAVMRSCIKPSKSASEGLNLQLAIREELLVDSGDLQFAASRRLDVLGYFHHLVGIEIQSDNGIVALRAGRFFLDGQTVSLFIELGNAITFGVADPITKDGSLPVLFGILHGLLQQAGQSSSVEDVVAEHQTGTIVADELFADDEGLGQAVG